MNITELTIIFWSIFWSFQIVKASMNALRHDYGAFKSRLGIPDKWDWWFDPSISWKNKYERGWFFRYIVPFSDLWHTGWTLWQLAFVVLAIIKIGWINGLLVMGVGGVFLIFNGLYNFLRRKKYTHL